MSDKNAAIEEVTHIYVISAAMSPKNMNAYSWLEIAYNVYHVIASGAYDVTAGKTPFHQ